MPSPHNVSQTGFMPRQIPSVQPRHLTVTITVRSSFDTTSGAALLHASSYVSIPHHSCFTSLVFDDPLFQVSSQGSESYQASGVVYEVGFTRTSHVAFRIGSLRLTLSES
ncbi:hypothetical protein L1887_46110 [Cichorium endivia]|nr:hypothetical protein L1887_46110 [Cichorium endivia]